MTCNVQLSAATMTLFTCTAAMRVAVQYLSLVSFGPRVVEHIADRYQRCLLHSADLRASL